MLRLAFVFIGLLAALFGVASAAAPPSGERPYEEFVEVFERFLDAKTPAAWNANFNDPDAPNHGLVDYGDSAVARRLEDVSALQNDLLDFAVDEWPRARKVDFLAVRAQMAAEEFRLKVSRPWARDPGFYVDQLQRFAFTDLPVQNEEEAVLRRQLAAVAHIVAAARDNLDDVARDYALLAVRNLTTSDGVGHGHPYRATPPAGVIGWYDDLLARARKEQPTLVPAVEAARASVAELHDWLTDNMDGFDGEAGVGADRYDWYLRHAKLLPYTGDELIVMAAREWDRLAAFHAIARHRNRASPELKPARDKAEYQKKIAQTDRNIRRFLEREEIITVPDYVGELGYNAPFIERPGGLNFWEAVQFRDPHPDHLHAVIPGHRFDGLVEDNNPHPIRGRVSDGVRVEGWAVYLEEAMLQAGVLKDHPRVDELIYLFGIFRAARVPADVEMQRNTMSVEQAVAYMRAKTPWLDENVARVDAEIYLRRPPGYGVGYTIGALQMRKLLADVAAARGEGFRMQAFHDDLMAAGRLPLSLIRWEMTGAEDDVAQFWATAPIPD